MLDEAFASLVVAGAAAGCAGAAAGCAGAAAGCSGAAAGWAGAAAELEADATGAPANRALMNAAAEGGAEARAA